MAAAPRRRVGTGGGGGCVAPHQAFGAVGAPPPSPRFAGLAATAAAAALAAAVAAAAFGTALEGDFVFDDSYAIVQNADVLPSSSVWSLWFHDFWGFPLESELSHKSYRPLTVLSFRQQVAWAGGRLDAPTAAAMHRVNVALHALNSALLVVVCTAVLEIGAGPAAVAGILFAAHPVHVEAVASLVGRAELLAAFFLLTSVLAYSKLSASYSAVRFLWA